LLISVCLCRVVPNTYCVVFLFCLSSSCVPYVAANNEATEPKVLLGQVEVITSNVLRSPPWLGWPLWNICVTNDNGYVQLVVNTSRSFPHSWLITRFVTRLTWWVPLVKQELLPLPEHVSSPPVFSGVHVTRSAVLCVCCLSFCTFCFGHCVVCTSSIYRFSLPLWYLQTPFTTFSGLSIFNCLCCIL